MKKTFVTAAVILILLFSVSAVFCEQPSAKDPNSDPNKDKIGRKTIEYFNDMFGKLGKAAEKDPNYETYREIMKPYVESIEGFYGGTLVDADWVIRQVYYPSHFLARGYDLKKVKELTDFQQMMKANPSPQLSEPAHGSIMQPRLIAMRYPVIRDKKVKNILSMMVRTEAYLEYTGLDKCKAYKIICRGKPAEEKGKMSGNYKEVKLSLPSTEWVIQYEK